MKDFLLKIAKQPSESRALLFAGSDKSVQEDLLWWFACQLLKNEAKVRSQNHPDLHLFKPEGKVGLHTIASMRRLIDEVYLPPFEAPCKLIVIFDADRMLPTSSNILLKTLEEPAPQTIIVLLAKSPKELLPTILSRLQILYLPAKLQEHEVGELERRYLNLLIEPHTYHEILAEVKSIASSIESQEFQDEAEKALFVNASAESLFRTLLLMVRDLELIRHNGNPNYLFFKNYLKEIEALKRHKGLNLKKTLKIFLEVKQLMSRSVPLVIVLENCLLQMIKF